MRMVKIERCGCQAYKQGLRQEQVVVYRPGTRDSLVEVRVVVISQKNSQVVNVPSYNVADVNGGAVGSYHGLVLQSMEAFVTVVHGSLCKGGPTDSPDSPIYEAEHRTIEQHWRRRLYNIPPVWRC